MSSKLPSALAALLLLASTTAWAQTPSAGDAEFVMKAAVGNQFEMEQAKLAMERATDPRIKDFAQRMMADHGDAMKKLTDAAGKAGQKPMATLDKPHQAMLDNLKGFNGTDFDKIYVADQIVAHAETVALLMDYQQNGQNSDLKVWAKEVLPIVKGHRETINAM